MRPALFLLALISLSCHHPLVVWVYGDGNAWMVMEAVFAGEQTGPFLYIDKTRHSDLYSATVEPRSTHAIYNLPIEVADDLASEHAPDFAVIGYQGGAEVMLSCLYGFKAGAPAGWIVGMAADMHEGIDLLEDAGVRVYLTKFPGLPSWAGLPEPLVRYITGMDSRCGEEGIGKVMAALPYDEATPNYIDWNLPRSDRSMWGADRHHISVQAGRELARRTAAALLLDLWRRAEELQR